MRWAGSPHRARPIATVRTYRQVTLPTEVASPAEESPLEFEQRNHWNNLKAHVGTYYHNPDYEALRCVLAACRAHHHSGDPIWLFVIGPSGSGKTAIIVNCASALDRTFVESNISTKSLISGMADGQKASLLQIIGTSGIIVFKDFTTILSKREDDQREIISQFREVYDGRYSIRTGQRSAVWEGKITVIAATTPAIERAWAVHRDLGERFLQVRWFNGDSLKIAEYARSQKGKEKTIASEMRVLTKAFFSPQTVTPALTDEEGQRIDTLATVIAHLRGHVTRESKTREVIDTALPEEPTRIAKALDSLVCHHAGLFGRPTTTPADFQIALRVGFDSVPHKRIQIMRQLPPNEAYLAFHELIKKTNLPESTLNYNLDELSALGLAQVTQDSLGQKQIRIHPNFLGLWLQATGSST